MSSIKNNKKSIEKREESLIDKYNDSNSRSLLKNSPGETFNIPLFAKHSSNRRTKFGGDLTMAYTAKFFTKKETFKKNRTLTFDENRNNSNGSETESSLRMLEQKLSKKSRARDESLISRNVITIEKTIVDNIENIYSQIKKIPIRLKLEHILIYLISILVGIFDWSFLFQLSNNKLERNYCFTNLYQFDSCSVEQICKNYKDKVNYVIYNYTIDIFGKTKNEKENYFLEENSYINSYYKQFFLKYSHTLATNHLLNSYQLFSLNKDRTNFAIILTRKQGWNFFLRYFFVCHKQNYLLLILLMYILGGAIGSIVFGVQADIRGRKKIIQITLFITLLGFAIFVLYFFCLDHRYITYKRNFRNKYSYGNENDIDYNNILENIYVQNALKHLVNKTFIIYLIGVFVTNFGSFPMAKICLALLLENSTNERHVLNNYRIYNFVVTGCTPLFTFL